MYKIINRKRKKKLKTGVGKEGGEIKRSLQTNAANKPFDKK
jgi:hypothetical protein